MNTFLHFAFAVSALYAVVGNAAVAWVLIRRSVPVRFLWSGTPGYLYRICAENTTTVGKYLRRFAFSTNVAFLVAAAIGLYFMGLH